VVLTKLDVIRAAAALSVRHVMGKPIKSPAPGRSSRPGAIPSGTHGLAHSRHGRHPFAGRGGAQAGDVEQAQKLAEKLRRGKGFDLEDFKQQLQQMNKMGGISSMIDKLPAQLAAQVNPAQLQDTRQFARIEASSIR